MDDLQFRQLIDLFGFSWAGFRNVRKGVKKRLVSHMLELDHQTISDYIGAIEGDREILRQFQRHMTVSISRFFRDKRLWEIMKEYPPHVLI